MRGFVLNRGEWVLHEIRLILSPSDNSRRDNESLSLSTESLGRKHQMTTMMEIEYGYLILSASDCYSLPLSPQTEWTSEWRSLLR